MTQSSKSRTRRSSSSLRRSSSRTRFSTRASFFPCLSWASSVSPIIHGSSPSRPQYFARARDRLNRSMSKAIPNVTMTSSPFLSPRIPRITIERNRTPRPLPAWWPGGSTRTNPSPSGALFSVLYSSRGVCDPLRPGFFFTPQGEFEGSIGIGKMRRRNPYQEGQGCQDRGGRVFGAGHTQTVRPVDSAVSLKAKKHFSSGYVL